jgi:hypothetical protein
MKNLTLSLWTWSPRTQGSLTFLIFLTLLNLGVTLRVAAQVKFFEEPIGWHGKSIELHTVADRDKQQNCLFLCNSDSIRAFVLDRDRNITQHFYFNRLPDEQFLGGFIKDGKVQVFLQGDGANSDLHVWVLDIAGGIGDDYIVPFRMRHERAVEEISCGDHFLFFTVNRKASQFAIYDFRENKRCDTMHYTFEDGIWKALTSFNGGWSRDVNVIKIDPDAPMNPDLAHIPNKLYWMHDSLFLLMNNYQRGITAVFSFDIRAGKVDFRTIQHNNARSMEPPIAYYVDNSMLLDGKLYFVSAEDNRLDVQVRDFYSGRLLKEYDVKRDEEITWKNTPIVQEGSFYKKGPRELARTRQLLRKMVSGSAVLMAGREDSGRVGLTVGAWQQMSSGGPGFGVGTMMMAGSVPIFVSTGVFFRNNSVRSSRFKVLLDSATLQHVPGEITGDMEDRIERYTDGISIPPEGENLFLIGGTYVYAYYNRDEHKLMLSSF